jgi:NRPS condensation-like uncharacterized protein
MNKNNKAFLPLDPMDRPMVWLESTGQMMIQLELEFAGQIDADRLADAALLTLEHEPVLKCHLFHHWFRPSWQPVEVEKADLVLLATSQSDYEAFKEAGIDTYAGPQIRVCLWNQINGAHLLIKVAHHVADAAGVKDIARVMSFIYCELSKNPEFKPKPNLTRQENTAQLLCAVPKDKRRALRQQFHDYMKNVYKNHGTYKLPFGNGKTEHPIFIQYTFAKDNVELLARYGRENAATLNDLLISAFFRSQVKNGNWDAQHNLRITTTIDMRRHLEGKKATAVSNLSLSLSSWPDLGNDLGDSFADTLNKVTSIIKRRKENYFGLDAFLYVWPMIRFMPHALAGRFVRKLMKKELQHDNLTDGFTNMGVINPADVCFDGKPTMAVLLPPPLYPPYFVMGASGYDGTLTISVGSYTDQKALSERFVDTMATELVKVVMGEK